MADHAFDFVFEVDGLESGTLRVLRFEGQEAISELSEFTLDLTSVDPDIELADVAGKAAVLSIATEEDPRLVHGLVSRFELTHYGRKLTYYRATLVPRAWATRLCTRSRIFQEKKTEDILKTVLEDDGVSKLRFALNRSYKPRFFCVQYRESDFAFFSRLMEEEGVFYYFDPTDDGAEMVISDHSGVHETLPCGVDSALPFRDAESGLEGGMSVSRFALRRSMRTGVVTLREFDFKKPSLDLTAEKDSGEEPYEYYDYPGEYPDPSHGKTYAEIRLQQLRTGRDIAEGQSNCRAFIPGHKFTLEEHPREAFNGDYLLTAVRHAGEQPQAAEEDLVEPPGSTAYRNRFYAIPAAVPFRPRNRTERPVIDGVQTAIVTGPPGEEIHCDDHGRVKIKFHWDREGPNDDKSSYWVRVSQMQSSGSMILPRIGWEVIVEFIEGDPDRPIIIGRLHNGGDPVHYGLPGAKAMTSFKSSTTPGGGSGNEFRMNDSAGSMEMFMNASRDMTIAIANNNDETVGVDSMRTVGSNDTHQIGANKKISVGANQVEDIGGNMNLTVGGNEAVKIGGNASKSVGGNDDLKVGGDQSVKVGSSYSLSAGTTGTQSAGAMWDLSAPLITISAQGALSMSGGAKASLDASSIGIDAGGKLKAGSGGTSDYSAGGEMKIASSAKVTIKAPEIILDSPSITLKAGGAQIVLKGGNVSIKGSAVKVNGSGVVALKGSSVTHN